MCINSNIPIAMLLCFSICSTKELFMTMTTILSTCEKRLQSYCDKVKFVQNIVNECGMPYIWNTHTLLILIGL